MPESSDSILPSKLIAPPLTPSQLERGRLTARMMAAGPAQVIVLRAPAGFGKTTVMLQLAARRKAAGEATAWLNLDASDDDLARFLIHLEAAMTRAGAILPAAADGGSVPGLLQRVGAATQPFSLFLDDFESVQSSAVLDLLRQLLDNLPAPWQVVIGSRTVPSLGLGRLRAHGRVLELGLEQLRFSLEEARDFLRLRRGLPLGDLLVDRLHGATEGWVTALWLASVALEGHRDPDVFLQAFSGSNAAIAEYLAEDVLAKQPEAVRDFLLRTSILAQLDAPLCDALLDRDDSRDMLAQIERANLFLVPADAQRQTYRYHALFAEFLRTQLAQREPAAVGALHLRAAHHYEAQGRPVPAIEHALRARDGALAGRLLLAHSQTLLHSGRFRLLSRWLDSLPAAQFEAHPMLFVIRAWALAFTHRYHEALALLQEMKQRAPAVSGSDAEALQANMLALEPMVLSMMDRSEGTDLAIRNHPNIDPRHRFPYSLLTNTLAMFYTALNRIDEARMLLDQARRSHHRIGSIFSMVVAECTEGWISLRQGRLQDAIARFRIAMNNMTLDATGRADGNPNAAVHLAGALYEAGQLDEAERLLRSSMPLVREVGQLDHLVKGHITLARLAWHRGEPERAFGILGELEYLGHQDETPRLAASAELERSRLALLRGDTKGATLYLRRAEDTKLHPLQSGMTLPLHDVESKMLARLRLRLRSGKTADLAGLATELGHAIEEAHGEANHRLALVLELLLAEAHQRRGRGDDARATITQALVRAAPEGIVQPFIDEGATAAALALWWCRSLRTKPPAGVGIAYIERLERACSGVTSGDEDVAVPAGHSVGVPPTFEALTFREIHVLKLLVRGQSNHAIAQALFVSENTVRTHLRNIFGKLGASNRTQAANLARQHRLID